MSDAKQLEVQSWLEEMVWQKYHGIISQGRLMRMRWVLTLKALEGKADKDKCKARTVLLGYTHPDPEGPYIQLLGN